MRGRDSGNACNSEADGHHQSSPRLEAHAFERPIAKQGKAANTGENAERGETANASKAGGSGRAAKTGEAGEPNEKSITKAAQAFSQQQGDGVDERENHLGRGNPVEQGRVEQGRVEQGDRHPQHGLPMLAEATFDASATRLVPGSTDLSTAQRLLDSFHANVFSYAYRLSGDASSADDIAQEVFVRAFRNLHQLREADAARAWLLVITRNEFLRWCSKRSPHSSLEAAEALGGSGDGVTHSHSQAIDRADWVQQALEQLPTEQRLVVNMFYFEQLSYAEIAAQLAIPMGTVMSRLNRARSHLKTVLNTLAEPRSTRGEQPKQGT